jgi:chromosome segregation ATPase
MRLHPRRRQIERRSMIQRYESTGSAMFFSDAGQYVLCSDHLAALAEKEEEYQSLLGHHEAQTKDFEEQIAALTAERDKLDIGIMDLTVANAKQAEEIERLRETGNSLREYLTESSGDERHNSMDIPDEIWLPFIDALKEADHEPR